jgi:hypothetical protein
MCLYHAHWKCPRTLSDHAYLCVGAVSVERQECVERQKKYNAHITHCVFKGKKQWRKLIKLENSCETDTVRQ